jgi:hypothetical protein
MAIHRLSCLHRQRLWGCVEDQHPPKGVLARSHADFVQALPAAKGHSGRSLRPLEEQGGMAIGRTRGGKAASLHLPPTGRRAPQKSQRSYEEETIAL